MTQGWRLQIALADAEVSVQEMAEELGVSRSTVSRWLNEHGAPPRPAYVKLWALRTGVSYAWLRAGWAPRGSNPEPAVHVGSQGADILPFPHRKPSGSVSRLALTG